MEGFRYNADKPILTPADDRPGKWPVVLREWKAARGLEADADSGKPKKRSRNAAMQAASLESNRRDEESEL